MKKTFSSLFVAVLLLTFVAAASASADTVTLPAMLSDLGEAAFQNDQSLDTVIVPSGVREIKALTFAGSSIKEIHLPASVTSIAYNAFDSCYNTLFYVNNQYAKDWAENHGFIAFMENQYYSDRDIIEISSFTVTNRNATFDIKVGTTQDTASNGYILGMQFSQNQYDIGTNFRASPPPKTTPMNGGSESITIDFASGYQGYVRAVMFDPQTMEPLAVGNRILPINIDAGLAGYEQLTMGNQVSWWQNEDKYFYFVAPTEGWYATDGSNMSVLRTYGEDSIGRGSNGDRVSYHIVSHLYAGEKLYLHATNGNSQYCTLMISDGSMQPLRTDIITINGKNYTASYFGHEDMSSWHNVYASRDFWRLEDAYYDFSSYPLQYNWLPSLDYPMPVEPGQVFVIDYMLKTGGTERTLMRCDGELYDNVPYTYYTRQFMADAPIRTDSLYVGGKYYTATYYGRQDMSSWNDRAQYRDFWRLENAYGDFQNYSLYNNVLPQSNYPMPIASGQVFVIDYKMNTGAINREVMRCDGNYWENQLSTWQIMLG